MSLGNWIVQLLFDYFSLSFNDSYNIFSSAYSPLMLICGIGIMCLLNVLPGRKSSIVNKLGGISLSIYLFHCHPLIKNDLFWNFFDFKSHINSYSIYAVLFFIVIATILCVFVLDVIEDKIFELIMKNHKINSIINIVDQKYENMINNMKV